MQELRGILNQRRQSERLATQGLILTSMGLRDTQAQYVNSVLAPR